MPECNPLLTAALSPLAAEFAALIKHHNPLLGRLAGASVEHFHIIGIRVHAACRSDGAHGASGRQDMLNVDLARHLCDAHHRTLLAEAMPGHSPQLRMVLRRMGMTLAPAEFYVRADRLLKTPLARILTHGKRAEAEGLSMRLLGEVEALLSLDPLVASAFDALQSTCDAESLHCWILFLRNLGLLKDDRGEAVALARAKPGTLGAWVCRRISRASAVDIGFTDTDELRMVRDVASLNRVARKLRNCLDGLSYALGIISGEHVILEWVGEGDPAAICLTQQVPGIYKVEEIRLADNEDVPPDVDGRIRAAIVEAGIMLVPYSKATASHNLGLYSMW